MVYTVSYTHSDAADEEDSLDLGGRRIIKKKKHAIASSSTFYYALLPPASEITDASGVVAAGPSAYTTPFSFQCPLYTY